MTGVPARTELSARDLSGWMTSGKIAELLKGQLDLLSARGDDVLPTSGWPTRPIG
jgi:hypothetical protein